MRPALSVASGGEMEDDDATRQVADFARVVAELVGPCVDDLPIQDFATLLAMRASELCSGAEVGVTLFDTKVWPSCAGGSTPRARQVAALRLRGRPRTAPPRILRRPVSRSDARRTRRSST